MNLIFQGTSVSKSTDGFAYYLTGFLITHLIITLVKRSATILFAIKYEKQKEV